jgi:hypothetical protein
MECIPSISKPWANWTGWVALYSAPQICGAQLSYVNSSDMQMYWHILHMWKHLWSMHIYLNILNMVKDS